MGLHRGCINIVFLEKSSDRAGRRYSAGIRNPAIMRKRREGHEEEKEEADLDRKV